MRVVLTSFGSTGDFEPFLALATELRDHGHVPILAFPPQFADRATARNLVFAPTGPVQLLEAFQHMIRVEMHNGTSDASQLQAYFPHQWMSQLFGDLLAACRHADVLICSAEWPMGRVVHELTDIPFVSVHLDYFNEPFTQASAAYLEKAEQALATCFNPVRVQFGLEPLSHMLTTDGISDQLALFAVSRLLLDPAKEAIWPEHYWVPGFFFDKPAYCENEALVRFLTEGEPPVVFTFGSMVYDNPATLVRMVLEVTERVGCRAILQHGWGGLAAQQELPGHIFPTDFVPYAWLFPQVSCVVQTGGAGTTAWALRCGIPTVCIPHLFQQPSFAAFAETVGAGVVIPYAALEASRLGTAVAALLREPQYRAAARQARSVIEAEGGVHAARQTIEQWYQHCFCSHARVSPTQAEMRTL